MATYNELAVIKQDAGYGALQERIRTAVLVTAAGYLDATVPTDPTELAEWQVAATWATSVLESPASEAESVAWYVIVANKSFTLNDILAAGDVAVQANVDAGVAAIVAGGA